MRQVRTVLMLMAILAAQQVFAANSASEKSCSTIADACLAAGFVKTESTTKGIWHDCMRPVILGKTVSSVSIDASVVKSCRADKIRELKKELKEMEHAK
jgi:hypothetical protein